MVAVTASADEALPILDKTGIDLLISDLSMPGTGVVQKVLFSGYTGFGQSRASQRFPRFECYPDLNHAGSSSYITQPSSIPSFRVGG
jgi:hypothetical protein